jgi:hypothetical protein
MMGALFTAVNEIVVAAAVSRAPPIQSLAFIDLRGNKGTLDQSEPM